MHTLTYNTPTNTVPGVKNVSDMNIISSKITMICLQWNESVVINTVLRNTVEMQVDFLQD